jgi:hypothetical protein
VAATELGKMWDGWMVGLSTSYAKTLDLLDNNKGKEAREEFRSQFVPTVKKVYTEAPQTYPPKFSKIDDWCAWVKDFYIMTLKAEKALGSSNPAEARKLLAGIREHLYKLHQETETAAVNDFIFALMSATAKEKPSAQELKALRDKLEKAKLSVKAKSDGDAYVRACKAFLASMDKVLQDQAIDDAELAELRSATASMYRSYGVQFE